MTAAPPIFIEQRIRVDADSTIVALSGKVDYGQGIRTAFAQLVAEELDVPLDRVKVVLGDTDQVPWDIGTYGSMSLAADGRALQLAAAASRAELLARASRALALPIDQLETCEGQVRSTRDGRALTYWELVENEPLRGVAAPDTACRSSRRFVGQSTERVEARDIVTGRARFVADLRLPGMLRGQVLHPPRRGARLGELDDSGARSLRRVVAVVRDGDFVGVVAEREEQALAAVQTLEAEWLMPETVPSAGIDVVLRESGDLDAAFAGAAHVVEGSYVVPHIANAPIGPSAALADVQADKAVIYAGTQRPFALRAEVAAALGFREEQVRILPQITSGTYGRNSSGDAPMEAARLSRAVGRPVLVQWTRADEFTQAPNRPEVVADVKAAVCAAGKIIGWRYQQLTNPHTSVGSFNPEMAGYTSGRNAIPAYRMGASKIQLHVEPSPVRTAAFRSLAAAPNIFAIESTMDELATAAGIDPLKFRLNHLDDPRLRRVLEAVAERSRWASRPRGRTGRGFGLACAIYHGTYVAEVAEVEVEAADGKIRLERMFCALDPGVVVNPEGARNQTEGGIQQAASWTLLERLAHRDGRVTTTGWESYPIATCRDAASEIDIVFVADGSAPMTGLGEPGSVPVAAAIANAVFAATGERLRTLPLKLSGKTL